MNVGARCAGRAVGVIRREGRLETAGEEGGGGNKEGGEIRNGGSAGK